MNIISYPYKKGYTLLFAVVVSSLVLAIAAFILSVSRKQFILASAARDSTIAFYAADSGIECAVEADDNVRDGFAIRTKIEINCNNQHTGLQSWSAAGNFTGMNFAGSVQGVTDPQQVVFPQISLPNINTPTSCILITVSQGFDNVSPYTSLKTLIDSRGYNTKCSGNAPIPGPRTVERALRLRY